MADKVLAKGFFGNAPRANAPAFVKGSVSVKVSDAIEFLNANKNEKGYVNIDLLENKTDPAKWNAFLNDFKPTPKAEQKEEPKAQVHTGKAPAPQNDDLPF